MGELVRALLGTFSMSMESSKGSMGSSMLLSTKCWVRSRAVSVTVQNRDGLSSDGGGHHNSTWLALGLWEDVGEVDAVRFLHNESPEPITDIELGEQDVQAGRRVSHVVQ